MPAPDDDPTAPPIVVPGPPEAARDPLQASATPASDPPSTDSVGHVPKQDTQTVKELTIATVVSEPQEIAKRNRPDKYNLTTDAQRIAILEAVENGEEPRAVASRLSVNLRTIYGVLSQSETYLETARAAFRKLLIIKAAKRLEDWELASQVGASKKGNHAPARDWLLHAGVIDPLDSDTASVKVAIVIGTDEHPMNVPSPLSSRDE